MPGLDPNSNNNGKEAPCRTCTDFKSWAKKQNVIFGSNAGDQDAGRANNVGKLLTGICIAALHSDCTSSVSNFCVKISRFGWANEFHHTSISCIGGSSSTTSTIMDKDKLKILCLHGYRQNAYTFKSKLGSFRKVVSKFADLTFLSAPHTAPPIDENHTDYDPNTQKSWWFNKDESDENNRTFKGTNKNRPAYGFEESLRLVEKTWKDGEYQGLLAPAESGVKTSATNANDRHGCPYDKDDLGRSTWGFLHTMAANYPDQPSNEEMSNMSSFFSIFAKVYPCDMCAKDFQKELAIEPVQATSQQSLAQWLCRMHNKVNIKLSKPLFDCRLVNERWRDGWKDGSCD